MDDAQNAANTPHPTPRDRGPLALIEWAGNKLPDPSVLFLIGALLVIVISALVAPELDADGNPVPGSGWEVQPKAPVSVVDQATGEASIQLIDRGEPITARNLLSPDGIFWCFETMVDNFINFPPLGIVLVGMLGIGVAERTGLIAVLLKMFMLITPRKLLTPAMVFIGVMSSLASDAGYVVLPPLAALLYASVGRSPLAGIAAVFAGVSAGFSANLVITGLDPLLAEFTNEGAQLVDENYVVAPTANWLFMIASTVMATLVGWATSAWFVEKRFNKKSPEEGGPPAVADEHAMDTQRITPEERRHTTIAVAAGGVTLGAILALILIPGAPLHGKVDATQSAINAATQEVLDDSDMPLVDRDAYADAIAQRLATLDADDVPMEVIEPEIDAALDSATLELPPDVHNEVAEKIASLEARQFDRWVDVIVPLIFIGFIVPGLAYGISAKSIRSSKDAAKLLIDSMAAMGPIIVLAFFAGQFIAYFNESKLGTMLAMTGGQFLSEAEVPAMVLVLVFILVTAVFNLFVGSMSAKYALFAPIFVPMFMLLGISPELTQVAYRVGDSVTNIITPLNAYLVIILVFMQKWVPKAGMGTLIAMMLPYSIAFAIAWSIMLLLWMWLGIPLGLPLETGPLEYVPDA